MNFGYNKSVLEGKKALLEYDILSIQNSFCQMQQLSVHCMFISTVCYYLNDGKYL
jgi:hypothetical protein